MSGKTQTPAQRAQMLKELELDRRIKEEVVQIQQLDIEQKVNEGLIWADPNINEIVVNKDTLFSKDLEIISQKRRVDFWKNIIYLTSAASLMMIITLATLLIHRT